MLCKAYAIVNDEDRFLSSRHSAYMAQFEEELTDARLYRSAGVAQSALQYVANNWENRKLNMRVVLIDAKTVEVE